MQYDDAPASKINIGNTNIGKKPLEYNQTSGHYLSKLRKFYSYSGRNQLVIIIRHIFCPFFKSKSHPSAVSYDKRCATQGVYVTYPWAHHYVSVYLLTMILHFKQFVSQIYLVSGIFHKPPLEKQTIGITP